METEATFGVLLTFTTKTARSELMRFLVERHDGHIESAFECWNSLNPPERFDGTSFHEFSESFCNSFERSLAERVYEPGLAALAKQEIILAEQVVPISIDEQYV